MRNLKQVRQKYWDMRKLFGEAGNCIDGCDKTFMKTDLAGGFLI